MSFKSHSLWLTLYKITEYVFGGDIHLFIYTVCILPGWIMYFYRDILCTVCSLYITWLEYVHLQGPVYVQCTVCLSLGWIMYFYRDILCTVCSLYITWLEYAHLQGPVYVQCTICILPGWNMYIYRFLVKIKLFFFFWWINKTTKINIIKLFCRLKYSASLPVTAKKVLLKKFSEIKF